MQGVFIHGAAAFRKPQAVGVGRITRVLEVSLEPGVIIGGIRGFHRPCQAAVGLVLGPVLFVVLVNVGIDVKIGGRAVQIEEDILHVAVLFKPVIRGGFFTGDGQIQIDPHVALPGREGVGIESGIIVIVVRADIDIQAIRCDRAFGVNGAVGGAVATALEYQDGQSFAADIFFIQLWRDIAVERQVLKHGSVAARAAQVVAAGAVHAAVDFKRLQAAAVRQRFLGKLRFVVHVQRQAGEAGVHQAVFADAGNLVRDGQVGQADAVLERFVADGDRVAAAAIHGEAGQVGSSFKGAGADGRGADKVGPGSVVPGGLELGGIRQRALNGNGRQLRIVLERVVGNGGNVVHGQGIAAVQAAEHIAHGTVGGMGGEAVGHGHGHASRAAVRKHTAVGKVHSAGSVEGNGRNVVQAAHRAAAHGDGIGVVEHHGSNDNAFRRRDQRFFRNADHLVGFAVDFSLLGDIQRAAGEAGIIAGDGGVAGAVVHHVGVNTVGQGACVHHIRRGIGAEARGVKFKGDAVGGRVR